MWLVKTEIREHYKSASGQTALLVQYPDHVVLTIRDAEGALIHAAEYKTRKGAAIALGRKGKWELLCMGETLKKAKTKGGLHRRCGSQAKTW